MKLILRNGGLFLGIWIAVMIIYAIANGVSSFEYLWKFSLLPGLVLASVAVVGTLLQKYVPVKKGINWIFLIIALGLDQGIKIYLFSLDWESLSIPLIKPVFYLEPTQNTLGSYLWVLLNFKKGSHLFNILLFSIIGFLFVEIWRFYTSRKRNSFWINGFIHLFLAGLLANIIDNAYWGGSLDYITIKPFYTFDLKDMYITLCELFLVTELVDNRLLKHLLKMPKDESKRLNNDFYAFIKKDLKSLRHVFKRRKNR
ncbi:MAG: signal peptidase II [Bacteroidales bacterium]|nr:signal peptidase II [Bacteroidales bacterium]